MLTIGERINATRKSIAEACKRRDGGAIRAEVEMQLLGGAAMLDVNGGSSAEAELGNMVWLMEIVAAKNRVPLCIDSANPAVMEAAVEKLLEVRAMAVPENFETAPGIPWLMLNSISAEEKRFVRVLPLVQKNNCAVVALCMGDDGLPATAEERLDVGAALVARLESEGVRRERIYIDPLVMPVGVNTANGNAVCAVISEIKRRFPGLRTVCGLSNVSYGMPARALINRAFLCLTIAAGVDAAILDTFDVKLMSALHASLALCDRDPFCMNYIKAFREKRLDV